VQWPIIWALLADFAGIQIAAPILFLVFLLVVHGRGRQTYTGMRQPVVLSAAHTFAPVVVVLAIVPALLALFFGNNDNNNIWQPFVTDSMPPFFLATASALAVFFLSYAIRSPREPFDMRYLKPLKTGYLVLAILLATAHGATLPWLLAAARTPDLSVHAPLGAMAVWLLAVVCDSCQHLGRPWPQIWGHAGAVLASCAVLGPGATTMLVWFWRESAMSRRMLAVLDAVEGLAAHTA
jgi:hypothetical protein